MAAQSIPADFGIKFADAWETQLQQENSKLGATIIVDSGITDGVTERWVKDLQNNFEFVENNSRFGKQNPREVTSEDRRLAIRNFEAFYKFDRNDKASLQNAHLPDSEVMMSLRFAWNRKIDDIIIEGAAGNVYVSPREAPVATALPAAQQVAVNYVITGSAANSGMTPWKILEGIRIMETDEVDIVAEPPVLVMSPLQKQDLIYFVSTAPQDHWAKMIGAWLEKPAMGLFGCEVIISNRLSVASSVRTCLLYTRRAFLGARNKFEFKVDELATARHAIQISAYAQTGIVRRWDKRVITIACDES
jgi:hypothetical protein